MSRAKLFTWSVVIGVGVTIALTWTAIEINDRTVSGILLWQDVILGYLVGPGPLLFVDKQGHPVYEGTPIHLLIVPVGFILSIPIYSVIAYLILRAFTSRLR